MPHIRTSRYGVPLQRPSRRQYTADIPQPTLGLHSGLPATRLQPGFTPAAQNFVANEGFLTPRSGLSNHDTFDLLRPALGAAQLFDAYGNLCGWASSASTFIFTHPDSPSWSTISYQDVSGTGPAGIANIDDKPSGLSTDYWEIAALYDKTLDEIIAVASNNTNWAKFFSVNSSTVTFSDFTWANSLDSTKAAKDIEVVNDRLVFFNTLSSAGTRFPQRVLWSARGGATDFILANGAGFEDLVSMRGEGTAAVRHKDFLILFTEDEVWRAQPTLDDYAFRFSRIEKVGCPYPRTAKNTPFGVMFLGRDFEVYAVDGISVLPVGPMQGSGPSRIQKYLKAHITKPDRAWAAYNRIERRYELYYSDLNSASGFPNRALYYSIDDRTWWPQAYNEELSIGEDIAESETAVTWGDVTPSWDATLPGWGTFESHQGKRWVTAFSVGGEIFSFRSGQTNDNGTTIDARWRSHGLSGRNPMHQTHLSEVWIDFENDSNSTVTVHVGSAASAHNFDSGIPALLASAGGSPALVPVWKTDNAPVFELRVSDGGRPRIGSLQATLSDGGRLKG